MNTVKALFSKLREQNIKLVLKGENLEVVSMGAKMSAELVNEIRELKQEIIAYLKEFESQGEKQALAIAKAPVQESYPLSSSQKRLWILSQFREGSIAYNMPNTLELDGEFDISSFRQAILATMNRHEVLRTVFRSDDEGSVRQWTLSLEESGFDIEDVDLSDHSDALESAQNLIGEDAVKEFDLENGPLLRAKLIRVDEEKYLFYYNMHHIVSDGWSVNVLINDVMAFYDAFAQGKDPELNELPIQYKDYAQWQFDQMNGGAFDAHKNYWTDKFSDDVTVLELPMQKPRPKAKSSVGKSVNGYLSAEATQKLKSISQENGGSLFMGVMATVKALLHCYTSEKDIIVGTPVAGRDHADLEEQIGFYVNMLPIRTHFSNEDGMTSLTQKVVENVSQGLRYQSYPFDALVEDLDLQRDATRNPLFNFSLTFDNINDDPDVQLSEEEVSKITIDEDLTVRFDLEFHIHEVGKNLSLRIIYNELLYDEQSIRNLLTHYQSLIEVATKSPETPFGKLEFISETEKTKYIQEFNNTYTDYPRDKSIGQLFVEQVSQTPDAKALVFGETSFTYKELDAISNQVARCLQENYQVSKGEMVGIQLDRSEWMIIAILAITKLGAAYVPVEPETPVSRKEQIFEDSGIHLLITEANYIFDLDYFEGEIFGVDVEFEEDEHSDDALTIESGPRDLAYVMFTSGSTGVPKGVLVENRSIVRLVRNTNIYSFSENDSVLSTGAPAFDATTIEYWGALLNGATLVMTTREVLLKPELLEAEIEKQGVNIMWFTAGWLSQLVETNIELFRHLKVVIAGGDRLPVAQIQKLRQTYPDVKLINGYGPTENTTFSLTYTIEEVSGDIPIGYPVSNSSAYILNDENKLQPVGIVGEICVGGDGLARGYLNDDDLTAQKFIAHPFVEGEKLYKTGDLGKWDSDGCVQFLGRKDDQVKIRGYRIELAEIERALSAVQGIEETVVLALKNDHGDKDLVAYLRTDKDVNSADIRAFLKERLPDYMIPGAFILLDEMPLTKNGKIDRSALPAPEQGTLSSGKELVEPRNETEEKLVRIWKEVLKKETVSVLDDFFELGGHSLKATILQNEYAKEFGVKPGFDELFSNTSLESHVSLVANAVPGEFKEIGKIEPAENYAISDGQRRLWVLSQFESAAYNMPFSMELQGEFDITLFENAIRETIQRHEILRTVFKQNDKGEVRQWVLPAEESGFSIDYRNLLAEEHPEQQALASIEADSFKPFNLVNGPLIRSSLFKIDDEKFIFYFNMHHIISDGWSMEVLSRDILAAYDALKLGGEVNLPELKIQYKDFATWQLEQLNQDENQPDLSFWMNTLSGDLPAIDLPSERNRPVFMTNNGHGLGTFISKEHTQQLKAYCQAEGGSLFMGLVAFWNVLMYKYTGNNDIILGSPVAGREHVQLKDQIGFYVNTLVLRNAVESQGSFANHFKQVRQNMLQSFEHQWYPFDRLIENLEIPRNTERGVVFDIMITLQNAGEKQQMEAPVSTEINAISDMGDMLSKFDVDVTFQEVGEYLSMDVVYNKDIYEKEMISDLIQHFQQLLTKTMENVDATIHELDILSKPEKAKLLNEFNNTAAEYTETNVLNMFRETVDKHPENVAVRFEGKGFTYRELDEKSSQLASYLSAEYGISANKIVGVRLERSEWQIMAILGILKTGGAYLPIDLEMPEERSAYLMEDSGISHCVDQEFLENLASWKQSETTGEVELQEGQLAYVMYTSGSTGKPKGVEISHESLADYVQTFVNRFEITDEDKIIQQSSLSFDVSVEEIFPGLCAGATIVLVKDGARDVRKLAEVIKNEGATILSTVPLVISELNEYAAYLDSIRVLISGGDVLRKEQISNLTGKFDLINTYGPTESTVCVTYGNATLEKETITIGKPIKNRQVYILDANLNLVPQGVIGEICVGGKGLAKGYLGREELTKDRFVANPHVEGERMYRTGDLGAWTTDGEIRFYGRNDDQVKIRGVRIELGEIEQTLVKHPDVNRAVVLAVNENDEKALVAFVELKKHNDSHELQSFLKQQLPVYMVPPTIIEVSDWPETSNGKLDKNKLIALNEEHSGKSVAQLEIEDGPEQQLANIWQEVLKKEKVWADSDFFALGGHSLKAAQLIYRIHEEFGVQLRLQDIFGVSELRNQLQLIQTSAKDEFKAIQKAPQQETYPVSHAQRRMWVLNQFSPEVSLSYNLASVHALGSSIDEETFSKAFDLLIERHESLRTIFVLEDDEPRQRILPQEAYPFTINVLDLQDKDRPETILAALIDEYRSTPFDLEKGPLLRASLIKMADKYVFVLNLHHIISDGVSMEILSRDLVEIYEALHTGKQPSLPALPIQFKDYVVWQNSSISETRYQEHREFWLNQFKGELPTLSLPISRPRPLDIGTEGRRYQVQLPNELSSAIIQKGQASGVTLFSYLLAGINILLHKYTGDGDYIIGTPTSGRDHRDLENQIGFFMNTVAIRSVFDDEMNIDEVVNVINTSAVQSLSHHEYPFDTLVDELQLKRDVSRKPLFDVYFNLLNHSEGEGEFASQLTQEIEDAPNKFDLDIYAREEAGKIFFAISANKTLFSDDSLIQLSEYFLRTLELMIGNANGKLKDLSLFREETTVDNTREFTRDDETLMHEMFTKQASQTPEKTAVHYDGQKYTYAQIDGLSNKLARQISDEFGVIPGDKIGLFIDTSVYSIIGLLAILKSGCAFVSLDKNDPKKRLQAIVQDAQFKCVITDDPSLTLYDTKMCSYSDALLNYEDAPLNLEISKNADAYIAYTSGSTGTPKGVIIQHSSFVNAIKGIREVTEYKSEWSYLLNSRLSFDPSLRQIFVPLSIGATLFIPNDLRDIAAVAECITSNEINVVYATPPVWDVLLETAEAGFKTVKRALSSGAQLPAKTADLLLDKIHEEGILINQYGPTEVCMICSWAEIAKDSEKPGIGSPSLGYEVYLVDSAMNRVPRGIPGEILVKSENLSKGYLNREELTEEKFISNPFGNGRVYRTGDLAMWRTDGTLEFLGRIDDQFKHNGYRIERGEIESVLLDVEEVSEAVVQIKKEGDVEHLVAYIVSNTNEEVNTNQVKQYLKEHLPTYMIPSGYVVVESIPLNANGKVDRKQLQALGGEIRIDGGAKVEPRTELESELCTVWTELLGVTGIGIEHDFFEIGGNSIKATRLIAEYHKNFNVKLNLRDFFMSPTIQGHAELIEIKKWSGGKEQDSDQKLETISF